MTAFWNFFFSTPNKTGDALAKAFLVCAIFFAPMGTAPTYLFMALTILAWLAAGGYQQRLRILRGNYFAYAALILFALLCIGVLYSSGPAADIQLELRKYAKLLFLLLAMTLLQDEKWRERALNAFALAMLITLTLSMASVVWPVPYIKSTGGNHVVFLDHIVQNLMMSVFVLITLIRSRTHPSMLFRSAYLMLALVAIANVLIYVQGRTGHIALAVILAVFIAFYIPPRQRWLTLVVSVLAGLAIFQFSDNFRGRLELAITQFENRDSEELTSVSARIDMYRKSAAMIVERPLLGWGTGSYSTEYCRRANSPEKCAVGGYHPHNQFLAFGVQLGLVGIVSYLLLLVCAVWRAWQFRLPEKVMGVGLVAVLLVDSMLHAPLFLAREAQFFILMLAVVLTARGAKGTRAGVGQDRVQASTNDLTTES